MPSLFPAPTLQTIVLSGKRSWKDWTRNCQVKGSCDGSGRVVHAKREVEVDYTKYTPEDYLFSWTTAVCGVELEDDGHTIVTPHNKFINDNGNAWGNKVLLESYHSFILAENYTEHTAFPEFSKGKILDAVAWVVEKQFNGYKEPIPSVFIDCLIATNKKKNPRLVDRIQRGIITTTSMGGDVLWTKCSRCGKEIEESVDQPCSHIKDQLGKYYTDKKDKRRRVAELCGIEGKPGSFVFKELSWVAKPAFLWAKLHGFLDYGEESTGKPLRAFIPYSRYREIAES
jgi:hypothetical protein